MREFPYLDVRPIRMLKNPQYQVFVAHGETESFLCDLCSASLVGGWGVCGDRRRVFFGEELLVVYE